ncbi:hypothetical protein [Prosthecomicrobium pneumaticum]|uniref:Uncharacterized protein n=1 Tax=Prosthecomicrobium pneumaticum TaxID=81895 RepID=A0A7W9FR01_9HYPH|nr:hypothetical protein [Prosthecomicrobium pneumaticum]MBB5755284.1 hypothetical protein [Prosthecomicrobium pneumaticum]
MNARALTGAALAAALKRAAEPAVRAGRERAAARLGAAIDPAIERRRTADGIAFAAPGLFAREHGGFGLEAAPVLAPAIARLRERRA